MIIDTIIFNNEYELLDLRLNVLDPVVDKFIIVESYQYHGSNSLKRETLNDHWHSIVYPFRHKVFYDLLWSLEPEMTGPECSWPRENFHRNQIGVTLHRIAKPLDIVLLSDCDEIPRPEAIRDNQDNMIRELHAFSQDFFYYTVNNYIGKWNGTVGGTYTCFQNSIQNIRNQRDSICRRINDGGWHFSYFGGVDRVRNKLATFAHAQEDSSKLALCRSREEMIEDIFEGRDIYQRPNENRKENRSSSDWRLPKFLLDNPDRFDVFSESGLRRRL